jgi:hypothetical protein
VPKPAKRLVVKLTDRGWEWEGLDQFTRDEVKLLLELLRAKVEQEEAEEPHEF